VLSYLQRELNDRDIGGGTEGYVSDITWRNTTIKTRANNMIIIPNSTLAGATIINYHLHEAKMSLWVDIPLSYFCDLDRVEKVTIEVGKETLNAVPGGVMDFTPLIRYSGFGENSLNLGVIFLVTEFKYKSLMKHEFIKRLYKRYKEEGIVMGCPSAWGEFNDQKEIWNYNQDNEKTITIKAKKETQKENIPDINDTPDE